MTRDNAGAHERAVELLCAYVTVGLDDGAWHELNALLEGGQAGLSPEEISMYEKAAAAVDIAMGEPTEQMPADLRARIEAEAQDFVGENRGGSAAVEDRVLRLPDSSRGAAGPMEDEGRTTSLARGRSVFPWVLAAAALALAFTGWWQVLVPKSTPPGVALAMQYRSFAETTPDVVRLPWGSSEAGFAEVRGEILWSDESQRGYMRFFGMPANDPSESQYQLWIVDPSRDKHPIDGGVFDIGRGEGEVIVPFESRLPASSPGTFAVTVEQPGGVVVSDGPLVLVASQSGS